MNTINSLLGRNSGGGAQGDEDTLAYNPAGVSFEEQDAVFIDPNGQLQEHLAATTITQQDVNQLGPTQQPAATAVGAAGGIGMATVVGAAEGMVAQAQPPGQAAGVGNPPQAPTEYSGLEARPRNNSSRIKAAKQNQQQPGQAHGLPKFFSELQPTASVPRNGRGPNNCDNDTHPWGILLH
jgi:hypothetical protein